MKNGSAWTVFNAVPELVVWIEVTQEKYVAGEIKDEVESIDVDLRWWWRVVVGGYDKFIGVEFDILELNDQVLKMREVIRG